MPHRALSLPLLLAVAASVASAQASGRPPTRTPPRPAPVRPAPANAAVAPSPAQTLVRLAGMVYDSVAGAPLSEASLQLVLERDPANARNAFSNKDGLFTVDSLVPGVYLLGVFHPRVDAMGMDQFVRRLDLSAPASRDSTLASATTTRATISVDIALPSAATLIAATCGDSTVAEEGGMFRGVLRRATASRPGTPGMVRVQWSEIMVSNAGVQSTNPLRRVRTDAQGTFVVCGVPPGGVLRTRAWSATDTTGYVEFRVPDHGVLLRDLYVGAALRMAVKAAPDSGSKDSVVVRGMSTLRGNGSARGVVQGTAGKPLTGARVSLWSSGVEATTSSEGRFALDGLPTGTFTVESRAVGYAPQQTVVDVIDAENATVVLAMNALPSPSLDTVRVRANMTRSDRGMEEFEQRKRAGMGYYLDAAAIELRNPSLVSDLFRTVPGLMILPGQFAGDQVMMRGAGFSATCTPTVFIDGMRTGSDGNLDAVVTAQMIRAVEVYPRAMNVPPQYASFDNCGSILVWTGPRK